MSKHKITELTNTPGNSPVILELIRYDKEHYDRFDKLSIDKLIAQLESGKVNWINVDGLHDATLLTRLQEHFCLHSLLLDDITNDQRPKAEEYEDYLFFTLKMLYRIDGKHIDYEQISFVLGTNFILSFQEKEGDLFDNLRERIRLDQGKVRKQKEDYLLYRLIDTIVDNYYTILDAIGARLEDIEEEIEKGSSEHTFREIQKLKRELIFLRKAVYPLRDAMSKLVKGETSFVQDATIRYFADVYDHVVHLIDSLDTYKDLTAALLDVHINTQNNRMTEVMKVLAIISTIFIPLTFIAGVYGMNFKHMPELESTLGYPLTLGVMGVMALGMLIYFKYKKWF
jgi:magnesium transporter